MNNELNNRVEIAGKVVSGFTYSHEVYGEKFYEFFLECPRFSENVDTLRIVVSERIMDINADFTGCLLKINGQFRSYNRKQEGERARVYLYVFVREVELIEELPHADETNNIYIEGYVCKPTNYRRTPLGSDISDVLLAVNRPYGKSDYLPCIVWNRNARWSRGWEVGERFIFRGRIQSREFDKILDDGSRETRTAYEVSVASVERVQESVEEESEQDMAETA